MTRLSFLALKLLPLTGHAFAFDVPDPAAPAINNEPRIWRALTGDLMELDGQNVQLRGVTCPSPDTKDGRAAKALLNTFLRDGRIKCTIFPSDGKEDASCTKDGRDFAAGMHASGLCVVERTTRSDLQSSINRDIADKTTVENEIRQLSVQEQIPCLDLELVDGTEVTLCLPPVRNGAGKPVQE